LGKEEEVDNARWIKVNGGRKRVKEQLGKEEVDSGEMEKSK